MINSNFIYLAAVLNLIGSLTYVVHTLKGETKPNRVSWFMWALAPLIAFAAMQQEGVGKESLMTFMVGFGPLMVLAASFVNKKAYWKLSTFDLVCGVLSLVGLGLWFITKTGNVAIFFSIIADGLAALPTLVKTYKDPESESYMVFIFGAISAVITMLTIQEWTFAAYGFPLYIFIICSSISSVGWFRSRTLQKNG